MKRRAMILWSALGTVMLLCGAIGAQAAEEGGSPAEQPIGMVFKWIHFAIVAGLVYWLLAKYLPPVFRRNADTISAAITKATAAKNEAERQLKEAALKIASLEEEVAAFRATAQKEAEAEVQRLRAATLNDAGKISIAAQGEIEAAERAARVELKALAARLAVDGAESLVGKEMTPAVQEALINSFVQSLQGRPN